MALALTTRAFPVGRQREADDVCADGGTLGGMYLCSEAIPLPNEGGVLLRYYQQLK